MSEYTTLLTIPTENILTITLNRPECYNALNETMKNELNEAFKHKDKDDNVRCIVLRGAGEKAFCPGQERLKESLEKSYNPLIRRMRTIEKPI